MLQIALEVLTLFRNRMFSIMEDVMEVKEVMDLGFRPYLVSVLHELL